MTVHAVHCADLHLDKGFDISNIGRRLERKEDLNRNFKSVVDYALKEHADLFLVSGDVFDRVSPSNYVLRFFIGELKRLKDAGIEVFVIGGNHDVPKTHHATSLAVDIASSAGLATVFSRSDAVGSRIVDIGGDKVCVSGLSYCVIDERSSPLAGKKVPTKGDVNILLLHGSFHGSGISLPVSSAELLDPVCAEDFKGLGLDYVALGHYHFRFDRKLGDTILGNPGSIECLGFGEEVHDKGFYWVEFDKEVSLDFVKLDVRPMASLEVVLSKDDGLDLAELIVGRLGKVVDSRKILRLQLKGEISQEQDRRFDMRSLMSNLNQDFFHVKLDRSELGIEGYGKFYIERVDRPADAFSRRMDGLLDGSLQERGFLERVREEGLRYLGGGV